MGGSAPGRPFGGIIAFRQNGPKKAKRETPGSQSCISPIRPKGPLWMDPAHMRTFCCNSHGSRGIGAMGPNGNLHGKWLTRYGNLAIKDILIALSSLFFMAEISGYLHGDFSEFGRVGGSCQTRAPGQRHRIRRDKTVDCPKPVRDIRSVRRAIS